MIASIVEGLLRAAATKYVMGVRQMWLYGLKKGDPLLDTYSAAWKIAYPRPLIPRRSSAVR